MLIRAHWPLNINRVITREFTCFFPFFGSFLEGVATIKPENRCVGVVDSILIHYNRHQVVFENISGRNWNYRVLFNFKSCPITYSGRYHWFPWQCPRRNQSTPADHWILLEWSNKTNFTALLPIVLIGTEQPLAKMMAGRN